MISASDIVTYGRTYDRCFTRIYFCVQAARMMRISLLLALALFAASSLAASNDAFVVVRKRIHTEYPGSLAVGFPFTVELNIFNSGKRDALDVLVRDNWGEESFDLKEGVMNQTWPTLPAGSNVTLNFTLVPKQSGEMQGFRGLCSYKSPVDGETRIVFSTPMTPHVVYTAELYQRYTASRTTKLAIFGLGWVF